MVVLIPERGNVFCLTEGNVPCNHHGLSVNRQRLREPLLLEPQYFVLHGMDKC